MLPYILLSASPIVLSFFLRGLSSQNRIELVKAKKIFLIICGILLFLFIGLRHPSLGSGDTLSYQDMMKRAIEFDSWEQYYNPGSKEVGFQFFLFCISRVFSDPQMLLVITAAIFSYSVCLFIYRNSDDVILSAVLFITVGGMTFYMQGMRQALAMSIALFAFESAKQHKPIRFLLQVTLATLFHQTAIVLLLLYVVRFLKYDFKSFAVTGLAITIFALNLDTLIEFANELFEKEYDGIVESGGYIAVTIHVLILVTAFLFDKSAKKGGTETMFLYVALAGAAIYVTRYFGVGIAERISFYFLFSQFILLPNALSHLEIRAQTMLKMAVYILAIALSVYRLYGSDLVPYTFFWMER